MKKILHVISSPRGEASYSVKLGRSIVDRLVATYPGSTVTEKNLTKNPLPHLEESHLASIFTPAEKRSAEQQAAIQHSDTAIREILDADIIVIGAPMWNFGIPSGLKAWIDHIARAGVTFKYDEKGPAGLVLGKKVYIALSSGAVYSQGAMQQYDFISPYLKSFLGFLGMTDVTIVRAEGTSMPGVQDGALEKALEGFAA